MKAYQKWFWCDSIFSCNRQWSRRMRSFLLCYNSFTLPWSAQKIFFVNLICNLCKQFNRASCRARIVQITHNLSWFAKKFPTKTKKYEFVQIWFVICVFWYAPMCAYSHIKNAHISTFFVDTHHVWYVTMCNTSQYVVVLFLLPTAEPSQSPRLHSAVLAASAPTGRLVFCDQLPRGPT